METKKLQHVKVLVSLGYLNLLFSEIYLQINSFYPFHTICIPPENIRKPEKFWCFQGRIERDQLHEMGYLRNKFVWIDGTVGQTENIYSFQQWRNQAPKNFLNVLISQIICSWKGASWKRRFDLQNLFCT